MQGQILSQPDIHRFFLKTSVVILAFLITSVLSQLVSLASNENKFYEKKYIAEAEVEYYKDLEQSISIGKTKKDSVESYSNPAKDNIKLKVANAEVKLKLAIAEAKLKSAKESIKTNDSIVDLNKAITDICMYLSPVFFIFGLLFWYLHLPYVQVPTENSVNEVSDLNENEFLVSILAKDGKKTKHHVEVHNK
ncbi:hypothetical protein [Candidatus Enterovibrio escicola]|uniref:hypothetical protein n=1 Tax=Candidatus Enterovibrio escicola TaxID=1927127 RepID=UPI0016802E6F|nr:hypothetical protein [Candidatus Enterovibrio escacola]